jgi:hypothetical protein
MIKHGKKVMILEFTHWLKFLRNLTTYDTLKKRSILNRKAESPAARLGRRRVWATSLLIAFSLCFSKDYSVAADKPMHYKQYAFIQLNHSFTEFYCLDELYHKESRWNPKAKNGSHYGIPQGRSKWLSTVDGYKQIEWQLKYIEKRYSNPCNALAHHKIKGWY